MSSELQCKQCDFKPKGKSGYAKESLKRHVKYVHDKVRDQKCSMCEYATYDYRILRKHLESQHGIVKDTPAPVKVDMPAKMSSDSDKTEVNRDFFSKCMLCEFKSRAKTKAIAKSSLKRHVKTVHNKERDDEKCCMCEYATYDSRLLSKHMEKQHGVVAIDKPVKVGEEGQKDIRDYVEPNPMPSTSTENRVEDSNVQDKGDRDRVAKTMCGTCGFKSRKVSKLYKHYKQHEEEQQNFLEEIFARCQQN